MSSSVATRHAAVAPVWGVVVAAAALIGTLTLGLLVDTRPEWGAAVVAGAVYVPLVMTSVAAGIAVLIPVLFLKTIPVLVGTCMLMVICAAWAGSLVAGRATIEQLMPGQRFLVGALALLLAWVCLSVVWADDPGRAWTDVSRWLFVPAILVVVATTIRSPGQLRLVLLAFVFGAVLSVVLGWLGAGPNVDAEPIDPAYTVPERFRGAQGDPNYLAAQLVAAIVLAAALVADSRRAIVRWGLVASIVVLAIGLASTQSRGGLIAAALVALAATVVFTRHRRYTLLVGLALVVTVAGTWLALAPQAPSRVFTLDDGGAGRSMLWRVAWRVADANPIEGAGANNFQAVAYRYVRRPGSMRDVVKIVDRPHGVHNTYLEMLAETGVVGLSLFLAVVGACLGAARRAATAFDRLGQGDLALLSRAVLLAALGALAAQLFLSVPTIWHVWVLLALGPALLTIASRPVARTRP